MSLKKIEQVKADKGFKIFDVVVYGLIAVLVVALFIAVFVTRDDSPLSGIRVYSKGVAVFEYNFEKDEYKQLSDDVKTEVTDKDGVLTVKITADVGYNVLEIKKSGSVKVTAADCRSLDCIYSPAIKDNSGIIYCSPHGLRIVPYNYSTDDPNVNV